ncbi:cysteine desulfurase [Polaribacter sp. WD7]|uniref:cysteine desulfurase family protein n=1 Tax=Polaribacter sp. WD7 TaxID=2269061 RepID=UPI000DF4003F|nr:cysteine desulfurase family protein [Polaribacter sp. WD7]RCS28065.1 cysteine desulfurase [Polaribacter sp. WD7]
MKTVYLDNAATTKIDDEVIEVMHAAMKENYGNPSSTHQFGRTAKSAVETARKNIASHFKASASEIIFTSGGTEGDNLILYNAVLNLGVKRILTSKIEHHAVLHTVKYLSKAYNISVDYVKVNEFGEIDLQHLEELLISFNVKTLVSLMHVNNEIGAILDLQRVAQLCKQYDAFFHSDTVQTIGHFPLNLEQYPVDFIVASAHKFHGPKGVGFAYFKKGFGILPMLLGGDQEKGARSGTENVHAILGMEKALQIALNNIEEDKKYILELKSFFISELKTINNKIQFNGNSDDLVKNSYTILNVRLPQENAMLLFSLDLAGISVSGGSACQSGSNSGSHVLLEILTPEENNKTSIRFSFSKYTTKEDIAYTIKKLKEILD